MFELLPEKEIPKLSITHEPDEEFSDNPDAVRWRAWWNKSYDGKVTGVQVQCYPVVRPTPAGAWINPHAYRQLQSWDESGAIREWSEPHKELLRWVSNDGGAAWAKPTKQAAINSLIYRHMRWSSRIRNDIIYFMQASEALRELFPSSAKQADAALSDLLFTARKGAR